MPVARRSASARSSHRPLVWLVAASLALSALPAGIAEAAVDHLLVSELVTGGASASDEMIELHNPTPVALPLEGLELIYVSASGATISRRALWPLGSPSVPPGGHVLVANEAGLYAPIADATYASGMAASGGSVALRIQGATTAIDAIGWGNATSTWVEGAPAPAPDAGASLERLPGGQLGSTRDTGDSLADFALRLVPEPQNLGSPPTPDPSASPIAPTPTPSPQPTADPPASPLVEPPPSPLPTDPAIPVAAARALPDGATATVEGVTLTSHNFHDGGGFLTDGSGGIAVLLADGAFPRGVRLRITGEIDDRFAQRTLRATAGDVVLLGTGSEPAPAATATGSVIEAVEGMLVRVTGLVIGSPTALTTGVAFDLDDGSGATRLIVETATGIDVSGWAAGTQLDVVGVAGQRDSSGGGTSGYRIRPRDDADIVTVTAAASPTPTPSAGGSPSPNASPSAGAVMTISRARRVPVNTPVTIQGTVTLPTGVVDVGTAAVQDASGGILVRLSGDAGSLVRGERLEISGTRSTLSGMDTVRITRPPRRLGTGREPAPLSVRTGSAGEAHESLVVVARGAVVASARRFASGTVSFEIDDGSGPLRVSVGASLEVNDGPLAAGAWVEVRGVLGQETSGSLPQEGYRIWPRAAGELRLIARVPEGGSGDDPGGSGSGGGGGGPVGSLDEVGGYDLAALRIGATLVAGPWAELGIGGLLWDGSRLVVIDAASAKIVAKLVGQRALPLSVELSGLRARGTEPVTGAPLVALGHDPGQVAGAEGPPSPPRGRLDGPRPAWVSVVGRLSGSGSRAVLIVGERRVPLDRRCRERAAAAGLVGVTGVAVGSPSGLVIPCDGLRIAPSLASSTATPVEPPGTVPTPGAPQPTAGSDRRPLAAGLLLVAAGVLAAIAAVRRLRGTATPPEPAVSDSADLGEVSGPARLTLVNVPREHGP